VIDMSSIKPSQAREHAGLPSSAFRTLMRRSAAAPGRGRWNAGDHGRRRSTETFDARLQPVRPMGRAIRVGPLGAGQLAKLANQAIVGIAIGAVAEATLLVAEGGGDLDAFRAALKGGFADSTILQLHGQRMQES
jgi:2-hydroxy-3-oxopropionate reductase